MAITPIRLVTVLACMMLLAGLPGATARDSPGGTETEIRIGQTAPYSGPASAFSTIGRAASAYVAKVNDAGGVHGRRIALISLDDGYAPPRAFEQTRKLVEHEQVVAIVGTVGTATNAAIQPYLNRRHVPHLFPISGATRWGDPERFPWTIGLLPSYRAEARIYARYILRERPDARIAVLYQNDDLGKDYLAGLQDGLGAQAATMMVGVASYEVTDPTIALQIATLKASGADTLMSFTTPKAGAQAIRAAHDLGWQPLRFLAAASSSISATLKPAGLETSTGIIGARFYKDPLDPQWAEDPGVRDWYAWMERYVSGGDVTDNFYVTGYSAAQLLVQVLQQCGSEVTRENILHQAQSLDTTLPMLLPGIRISTGPTDYVPIKQMQLARFNGRNWEMFGPVLGE